MNVSTAIVSQPMIPPRITCTPGRVEAIKRQCGKASTNIPGDTRSQNKPLLILPISAAAT